MVEPVQYMDRVRTLVEIAQSLVVPEHPGHPEHQGHQGHQARPQRALSNVLGQLALCFQRALALVTEIHCDPAFWSNPFEPTPPEYESVADIAFQARLELRHVGGWIVDETGPIDSRLATIAGDRLRHNLVDILVGVEIALAESLGRPSQLQALADARLERAQVTRRVYYRFIAATERHRVLLVTGYRSHADVVRASATALTALLDDPLAAEFRAQDRQALQQLLLRISIWQARPSTDDLGARRLWNAVVVQAEALGRIQHRRVLIETDLEFAAELLWAATLERALTDADPRLRDLGTRAPDLAAALGGGRLADIGRCLARVHDELATSLGRPSLADRRSALDVISI